MQYMLLVLRGLALAYLALWLFVEFKGGRKTRVVFAVLTLAIGYVLVSNAHFGYEHRVNAVYSSATSDLVRTTLRQLEQGNTAQVIDSLRWLDDRFAPTWKDHPDFDALIDEAEQRMAGAKPASSSSGTE